MSERLAKKVLLVGWDAADWKIINPLMDQGKMPALRRLVNRGVMGNLATLDPPLSPMLWSSIATGKTADKHGVLGFTQPTPDGDRIQPILSTSRKVKALWNILSQEGFASNVVGWWPSHPAEPINGVSVSDFYQKATAPYGQEWPLPGGAVHPEALRETLAELRVHPAELTGAHLLPFVPKAGEIDMEDEQARKRLAGVPKILAHAASLHAATTWIMENRDWDFMAVYHDAIDHFGHGYMKFHPPRRNSIPEDLYAQYKGVVEAGYRFHDMMLGRLLDLIDDETAVLLISDHGFHSDHLRPTGIPKVPAGPAIEHRNFGIFCMAGPHVRRDERVYGAGLLDVAPTVLSLFGLPIGRDMDGKPLAQSFDEEVDLSYIDSWEDVEGDAGMHAEDDRRDPWAEQEALEQLIDLGYVEAPGENQQKAIEQTTRESQYYLARVYFSTGRPAEAVPILRDLRAQAPDEHRYGLRLAKCYQALGRLDEARRVVDEVMEHAAEQRSEETGEEAPPPTADFLKATFLLDEGKAEEALEHLERAEGATLARPKHHQRIGQTYLAMERWQDAERAFRQALDIDPDSAVAQQGMACACLRQNRNTEAAEAALRAVGLYYFYPSAHYFLGVALMRLGRYERAAEAFEVCVQQAPGVSKAHRHLSRLYAWHLGQPEKAAEHERFLEEHIEPASGDGKTADGKTADGEAETTAEAT